MRAMVRQLSEYCMGLAAKAQMRVSQSNKTESSKEQWSKVFVRCEKQKKDSAIESRALASFVIKAAVIKTAVIKTAEPASLIST
jgi:hypothetical protein